MSRTYLFFANSGDDTRDTTTLTKPDGSQTLLNLLAQHHVSDSSSLPDEGYRLSEYKSDTAAYSRKLSAREAQGSTHHRPGPWVVTRVESYLPDLPVGTAYSEVLMCWCDYQPLPETDNPWREMVIPELAHLPDEALDLMGLQPEQYEAARSGELSETTAAV